MNDLVQWDLLLKNIVDLIIRDAKEIGENKNLSEYEFGVKMGLLQALSIMKANVSFLDGDNTIGLNIDLERDVAGIDVDAILTDPSARI